MASKKSVKQKTLPGDLLERRVPQIIGVYLAISWGLIQFIDWVATRFVLSPFLPEFAFVLLLSVLPTVILLAFFHGRPGRDRWAHVEVARVYLDLGENDNACKHLTRGLDIWNNADKEYEPYQEALTLYSGLTG